LGVYFRNDTNSTIWLAFASYSPGCEGGVNWEKKGWYEVRTGQTAKVWTGWAGGDCFLYYAEDDNGHVWAGPHPTQVPWNAFTWCWNTGCTTCRTVGFRSFCVSSEYMDYTGLFL
jgi:hypothetical protein